MKTTTETLREIKKDLRAAMNGKASKYMRDRGLGYHVNFGVELPRLMDIAGQFAQDAEVARALWHENVRESKLLATMLMPTEAMGREECEEWLGGIPNAEVAQMAVFHLFSRLPFAACMATEWLQETDDTHTLCGLLLATRLHILGIALPQEARDMVQERAEEALQSGNLHLRKAAQNAQSHFFGL